MEQVACTQGLQTKRSPVNLASQAVQRRASEKREGQGICRQEQDFLTWEEPLCKAQWLGYPCNMATEVKLSVFTMAPRGLQVIDWLHTTPSVIEPLNYVP